MQNLVQCSAKVQEIMDIDELSEWLSEQDTTICDSCFLPGRTIYLKVESMEGRYCQECFVKEVRGFLDVYG